jgi:hypothetical protein
MAEVRAAWSTQHERSLREHVERLFRSRTPPQNPDEVLIESRVPRTELRAWAADQGVALPEMDVEWTIAFAKWYRRMARRVSK